MITITRRQVHALRQVFRRAALGITHRGTLPPLVFEAQGTQLCLKHRYEAFGIACVLPGRFEPLETILLPLDALGDFEGKQDTSVVLEAAAPDRTVVRWEERHVPQTREYVVPAPDTLPTFPEPSTSWSSAPAELLNALAAAAETCTDSDKRYALSSIQLRGRTGEIIATDGRQLLIQGGFHFPWDDDVLLERTPLFASPALPRDEAFSIGKTETHVLLRVGQWTLFLEVQKHLRYPETAHIVPEDGSAATRLRIDDLDAAFLVEALAGLPRAAESYSAATLDLNGRVALRVRGGDPVGVTELVLSRSRYTGDPVRLNGERDPLARALGLGFRELEIQNARSPISVRDSRRVYVWQPLDHESAIEPTEDVTQIESCPDIPGTAPPAAQASKARTTVNERTTPSRNGTTRDTPSIGEGHAAPADTGGKTNESTNSQVTTENASPTGLAALIQEAEALHEILSDAKTGAGRLIGALRRHRKQSRLVQETLRSLRQLKLQDVAE